MDAVIPHLRALPGAGLFPIAGRPLIARQLEWLRTIGCAAVAVEIGSGVEGAEVVRWLTEEDAGGAGVSLVRTGRPLSPRQIARRAGFEGGAALLVIPADVVPGGRLKALLDPARGSRATTRIPAPAALAGRLEAGEIHLLGPGGAAPILAELPGWSARIRSLADAMALGVAALDGRLSARPDDPAWALHVHAAETSPGIWVSRGARIEAGAELVAPALIGAGAVLCAGARVGPRVCVGDRAVVESGTVLSDALVSAGTIVGEGLALAHVVVGPWGLLEPTTGERCEVSDPLVLAARDPGSRAGLPARALALALLVALLPPDHSDRSPLDGVRSGYGVRPAMRR